MIPGAADYITCALWSSNDDDGEPLDSGAYELDPATEAALVAEWEAFAAAHADVIGTNVKQAAHDFWLTRNGHGAGFWDGDWPEPAASLLTKASKEAGERNLYIGDDSRIYCYELPQA